MINVPRILRDKSLISLVNFCYIKEPSVVYNSMRDISSKMFNYNNTVKELDYAIMSIILFVNVVIMIILLIVIVGMWLQKIYLYLKVRHCKIF